MKNPKDVWEKEEFSPRKVKLVSGEVVEMQLAERGVLLGGIIWIREFRRLMEGGLKHILLSQLPKEERFQSFSSSSKDFFGYNQNDSIPC